MDLKEIARQHRKEMALNRKRHAAFFKRYDARIARLDARLGLRPSAQKEAA